MQAKVLSCPEPSDEAAPYLAAFHALSRDRPMLAGMSVAMPLPVPGKDIDAYLRRIGIDEGEIREFTEIVVAVDDYFVELEAKRILADVNAAAAKSKR